MQSGRNLARALRLLAPHKALVATLLLLQFIVMASPFVVGATFGPLLETLGTAAAEGSWEGIWTRAAPLYSKPDSEGLTGVQAWLAIPIPFWVIFVTWAGALVFSFVLRFLLAGITAQLERRVLANLRRAVHDHVQSRSLDFFSGGQTGALMQRVLTETTSVQRLLTTVLLTPLVDIVVFAIALFYLVSLSLPMTPIAFALAPLTVLVFQYTSAKLQTAAISMAMSSRELSSELEETINGIADIQVFNAQRRRSERFNEDSDRAARALAETGVWMNLSNDGAQIVITASTALVLLVGIQFGSSLGLTFGSVIVFFTFTQSLFLPVQSVIASYTEFQSLAPNVVSTFQLLDTKPTIKEKPGAQHLGSVRGDVVFEDVVFGYAPTQNVLDGLSFRIREGETVALVGAIGSGKSTILNLLLRFLEPQGGRILLDGRDVSDVTLSSLREQVSKLSQFPFFLKDTIRENVRLGKPAATDAEVEEVCKLTNIHDVIVDPARMPLGYGTVVDVQVPSGGQKRLIALARCLLRWPEVLLFDEPTENLDADQCNRLVAVIRGYAHQRTCLVISHDLGFVAQVADRILVLENGRVAAEGTHQELLEREGLYKTLNGVKDIDPSLLRRGGGGDGSSGAAAADPALDQLIGQRIG